MFGSAQPVVRVAGEARPELSRDVLRLDVEEGGEGLKTMTLRLAGAGPRGKTEEDRWIYLDASVVDFGSALEVSLGTPDAARTVFSGTVSALEAAFGEGRQPEVVVFAEDALMKLRMTRRSKTYENVTDADVASAIATEHSLGADVSAKGPTYDRVQQWNQSDLAFLRERARLVQADVWVHDGKLHFQSREARQGTELTLVQGNELIDVQIRADLAHQRSKVKVTGYDARERDRIEEEAGEDVVAAEVSGGRTGPSVLALALGERPTHVVRDAPLNDAEATDWARAEMLRRCRSFVTVSGTTSGSPDMTVGSRLTLERVGKPFNGPGYYVTRVRHSFDRTDGFRTRFEAERATVN